MKNPKTWFVVLFIPLFSGVMWVFNDSKPNEVRYVRNASLNTVHNGLVWKGTPKSNDGTFRNLYQPFESSFWDLLKWKTSDNPYSEEKEKDLRRLKVVNAKEKVDSGEDFMIWLGHASFLFRIQGVVYLIDPILMDNIFLKREAALPLALEDFPRVDYILISHNHRDHCDKSSIRTLATQYPEAIFLTGLEMKGLLKDWVKGNEIQEAGWFQKYQIDAPEMEITYVPSRHWTRRWLSDTNKRLWGGFFLKTPERNIYFMGDSGDGIHFEEIAEVLGPPDIALMGVGAFRPEWFMEQSHISPTDAIQAFNRMGGKAFFPMHFGTFDLSDEPMLEPLDILLKHQNELRGELIYPIIGEDFFR
jgi:L-ascorbate metabolism protein UlaG (beta-lactamase superfamily)